MVSSGQQVFHEMWAKNKDALTVLCLEELAGADVSLNVRWEGSPDVVVAAVLESEFSLPTRRDMTRKRARSAPEADAVLEHGSWKIILQDTGSTCGSPGASQPGLQGLTPPRAPTRKPHRFHQYRRRSNVCPRPIGMAPSPPRHAPSRSRSPPICDNNARRVSPPPCDFASRSSFSPECAGLRSLGSASETTFLPQMILIAEIDFAHQNCVSFLMPARLLCYCPVSAMAFRMHRFWTAAVRPRTAGKGSHCSAVKCFVRQEKVCIAPQWSCVHF